MSIPYLQIKRYEQEHGSNQSTYWVRACTHGLEGVLCSSCFLDRGPDSVVTFLQVIFELTWRDYFR